MVVLSGAGIPVKDEQTIVFVLITAFVAAVWLFYRVGLRHRPGSQLPAGPWYVPLIGSPQLFTTSSHIEVTKLGKIYGKAFTLHIGTDPLIVLNDYRMIKEALVQHADVFSDRFTFKTMERTIKLQGSLIFENGTAWKTRRHAVLSALHRRGVRSNAERNINEETCFLCEEFSKRGGHPFDPSKIVMKSVSNIICSITYGKRFSYSDPVFMRTLSNLDMVLHCSFVGSILRTLPVVSHLPGFSGIRRALGEVFDFNRAMVREHNASFNPDNLRDVIDTMLNERLKERERGINSEESIFTDELIARSIYDLFAAGTDTNTNTLLWALLLMTQYPDVQTKVQKEIDSVTGSRGPSMSDSASMPYTTATIMEVQRYRVAAPFVPPRCTNRDVELQGMRIPSSTQIWVNLWAVLHDPTLWSHPERFDPSRFLADEGRRVIVPEAFIPFGAGRRVCLGKDLSIATNFLCFTKLMQTFSVSWPTDGGEADLSGNLGLTLAPKKYKICVRYRENDVN
ncbi:cytochrome P450 2U1-like [Acanthaster planci]|uniref:Cytochrome P450 2U1-like n=1 Tax=Acanthaster planci TaxID=133434 RepID=A0A8B7ZFG4_ACAPL|nr:cytochrome P450 2U1-like [Acanthaster planci]